MVNDQILGVASPFEASPGSVQAQNESQALSAGALAWRRAGLVYSLPGHGQDDNRRALLYAGGDGGNRQEIESLYLL